MLAHIGHPAQLICILKIQSQRNSQTLETVAASIQILRWPSPITSCATNMVSTPLLKLFMISFAYLLPNLRLFVRNMEKTKQQNILHCHAKYKQV